MYKFLSQYWWVLVLRGVIAILFGVLAFVLPLETMAALALVFGAYAFADGIFAGAAALAGRKMTGDWWVLLLQGLVSMGVAVLAFVSPAITAVGLLLYIAAWALMLGVLQVIAAIRLRHDITGEWWLGLGGVLAVAFGAALLWRPGEGAFAVLWMIATFAIVWGVMLMIGGFDVHHMRKHAAA